MNKPNYAARANVEIASGYKHPVLGPIGGWRGVVRRSFKVRGESYWDIEVAVETLSHLDEAEIDRWMAAKIVFTRVRLPAQYAVASGFDEPAQAREANARFFQRRYYQRVGARKVDPTAIKVSEAESGCGRRVFMGVGIAILASIAAAASCNDCNCNGGGGSWGRGAGGWS